MPCCDPAVFRQCRVLRESPRVAGKIRNGDRETPRGSRKEPNLDRSVNSHTPCCAPAVLCRGLEKSLAEWCSRTTAGARYGTRELALKAAL